MRPRDEDIYDDPVECSCGFAHFSGKCVYCEKCRTWQHEWCYYKTETIKEEEEHVCDNCSTRRLEEKFAEVQIEPREKDSKLERPSDGILGEGFFYGLGDKDVQYDVRRITSMINTVAHSLDTHGLDYEMPSSSAFDDHPDLFEVLQTSGFYRSTDEIEISAANGVSFLRMVIGSAVWNWTFYAPTAAYPADRVKSRSEALLDAYRETSLVPSKPVLTSFVFFYLTLISDERKVLRIIHCKAWMTLIRDRPSMLNSTIAREAEIFTNRLFCMLSSVLRRSNNSGDLPPLKAAEDWIITTKSGRTHFKYVQSLFAACIQLRNRLPLSECYYEIHYPASVESQFLEGEPGDHNREIEFCLSPAVLEFDPKMFSRGNIGASVMPGEQNFIHGTDEQRKQSRVVCPARVTFR